MAKKIDIIVFLVTMEKVEPRALNSTLYGDQRRALAKSSGEHN